MKLRKSNIGKTSSLEVGETQARATKGENNQNALYSCDRIEK